MLHLGIYDLYTARLKDEKMVISQHVFFASAIDRLLTCALGNLDDQLWCRESKGFEVLRIRRRHVGTRHTPDRGDEEVRRTPQRRGLEAAYTHSTGASR